MEGKHIRDCNRHFYTEDGDLVSSEQWLLTEEDMKVKRLLEQVPGKEISNDDRRPPQYGLMKTI